MKFILLLSFVLTTYSYSQQITFVKDSIMDNYMTTGFSTKNFKPNGIVDNKKQRQGQWKDYEVVNDFSYISSNGKPKQVFGRFLLYGEGEFVDDKREGHWKFYVIENNIFKKILQKELYFNHGQSFGSFKYYYPNGQVGIDGNFVAGEYDGEVKSYYDNGKPYGIRQYSNGLRIGKHIYLYSNGQTYFEQNYVNDTLHGLSQSFYENGTIEEIFYYKMGLEDGNYKYYYSNGQLWIEKDYRNGFLLDVIGNYDIYGNQRDKGTIKDGNGTVNYYTEEGKLNSTLTYKDGKIINEKK